MADAPDALAVSLPTYPDIKKIMAKRVAKAAQRKRTLDYHKKYNEEHAEDLSKAKKNRYATDPAYKEAVKRRAAAAYLRRKQLEQEIRKVAPLSTSKAKRAAAQPYCPTCLQPLPRPAKPVFKLVDKKYAVAMFTIREIALRLSKQTQTVQIWMRTGILPDTLYKDRHHNNGVVGNGTGINTRLWTQDQVEMLMRVFAKYDLRPPTNYTKCGLVAEVKKEWDALRPLGINPALYKTVTQEGFFKRESVELPLPAQARKPRL